MKPAVRLYNTLTKRKELLSTRVDGILTMYVCGLTPYDSMHIGHARTFVLFDAFRRYLQHLGWSVVHIQNWTDIDDKIVQRAHERGRTAREVAEEFITEALKDSKALGMLHPHIMPRVTHHIPDIIGSIENLISKGYAYKSGGDVYFSVSRYQQDFSDYGDLSGQDTEEIRAGARVEPGEGKRDPVDFALWKAAKEGEPTWESPWGPGRPGWHIECSVMSLKYLGHPIDLHGAAVELVFPHHENEKAQSQALTGGKPVVRHWMHCGVVNVGGEKMSKSLGNVIPVATALRQSGANALRLLFLSSHYRSPLNYTDALLAGSSASLHRLSEALIQCQRGTALPASQESATTLQTAQRLMELGEQSSSLFYEALSDDFNTAEALGYVFRMVGSILTTVALQKDGLSPRQKEALNFLSTKIQNLLSVLGFDLCDLIERKPVGDQTADELIGLLVEVRQRLRAQKQYEMADWIRSLLGERGIVLEDTPSGTRWRRQ